MSGRIDMTSTPELLERRLDLLFEETQHTHPQQAGPRWWRRWLCEGRSRHRARKYSQTLATDLIGQPS